MADSDVQIDLRHHLGILRARKWTIILVTTLVITSALAFSFTRIPLYSGTARLVVIGPPSGLGPPAEPNLETEAEIVASHAVATLAVEDLDLNVAPEDLTKDLRVDPAAEESSVLTVTYTSPDPELAGVVPDAFVEKYIEYKRDSAQATIDATRDAIQDQIDPIDEQLEEVNQQLGTREAREDLALKGALETQRAALTSRMALLQQRLGDVLAAQPLHLAAGELIEPAEVPTSPSSPNHVQNGILAALLGLALGIAVAFLRERLDDRLKGRDDLETVTQAPVLGTIPRYTSSSKQFKEIVTISQPQSAASEAYRSLRTNVQFLSARSELRTLLVTSALAGEGKTVTSVNVATTFARAGRRVILVSADLRRPTLETYFGFANQDGLRSWLLAADRDLWSLIVDPGIDNLRILPSGPPPPNPAELLNSPRFGELIRLLRGNADLVVIDSAPALAVADPSIISSQADATLLVVNAMTAQRSTVSRAFEELRRVGADVLGSVLNSYDPSASGYYSKYGYGTSYQSYPVISGEHSQPAGPRARSPLRLRRK